MYFGKMISRFLRSGDGNVAMIAGIMIIPIMLSVGLAVDFANMSRVRGQIQAALDVAAMQIALNASSGMTDSELETFGNQVMLANLSNSIAGDSSPPVLHYYGIIEGTDGSQTLSADADYNYRLLIMRSALTGGSDTKPIHVDTEIKSEKGDPACVYALSKTASRAINVSGSTSVNMDGCVVASNSRDNESIYVGGSAAMHADCAQAAGTINATAGFTVDCDYVHENAWISPDPFADVPEPIAPALMTNPSKSDATVDPGRYSDLTLDGTKTLNAGTYYIEGTLTIKGDISGSGVFFYMKDGALTVNASASLHLDSSTDAANPYHGILFMNARDNANDMKFNGNGETELNGYIYSLSGEVFYSGNNSTTSTCLRIAADTVTITGNTDMKADCTAELAGREAMTTGPLYYSM
jgi:phage baseplate assembly protein gpV